MTYTSQVISTTTGEETSLLSRVEETTMAIPFTCTYPLEQYSNIMFHPAYSTASYDITGTGQFEARMLLHETSGTTLYNFFFNFYTFLLKKLYFFK